jgi:hypothetical protein
MAIRTSFKFTLPVGTGIKTETGRKASGVMRLTTLKDILEIERDAEVQRGSGAFYLVLLSRVISSLGSEKMITRKTIEQLNPADFTFLVDFVHTINHQVIKRVPVHCTDCGHEYLGEFGRLGEA